MILGLQCTFPKIYNLCFGNGEQELMGMCLGTQIDSYCRTATFTKIKLFVSWKSLSSFQFDSRSFYS